MRNLGVRSSENQRSRRFVPCPGPYSYDDTFLAQGVTLTCPNQFLSDAVNARSVLVLMLTRVCWISQVFAWDGVKVSKRVGEWSEWRRRRRRRRWWWYKAKMVSMTKPKEISNKSPKCHSLYLALEYIDSKLY